MIPERAEQEQGTEAEAKAGDEFWRLTVETKDGEVYTQLVFAGDAEEQINKVAQRGHIYTSKRGFTLVPVNQIKSATCYKLDREEAG